MRSTSERRAMAPARQAARVLFTKRSLRFLVLFILAAGTLALLAASGCRPRQTTGLQTATPISNSEYAGNEACADCHPREFKQHKGSRHDVTMRLADPNELGTLAPRD